MTMTILEQLLHAGLDKTQYDTWASDLYVPVNDITKAWVAKYEYKAQVTVFTSETDGKLWYDIPFGYIVEYGKTGGFIEHLNKAKESKEVHPDSEMETTWLDAVPFDKDGNPTGEKNEWIINREEFIIADGFKTEEEADKLLLLLQKELGEF